MKADLGSMLPYAFTVNNMTDFETIFRGYIVGNLKALLLVSYKNTFIATDSMHACVTRACYSMLAQPVLTGAREACLR